MFVSCIMPTRGRPEFAVRALEMWKAQTHRNRELVIIDDADAPSFDHPPEVRDVVYQQLPQRLTVGAKRNIAVKASLGPIICHWDDDDIHGPKRIENQLTRLTRHGASVTGYHTMCFVDEDKTKYLYTALRQDYPIGSSLMYSKTFWTERGGFKDIDIQEDTMFCAAGAVCGVAEMHLIATIHDGNTSPREVGKKSWQRI